MPAKTDASKRIITIPNLISVFRLLLIPVFVYMYTVKSDELATVIILAVSGASDVIDGVIARKFNMVSDFGKVLDPVADKFTQIAMLICLIFRFWYLIIPLSVLALKELVAIITGIAYVRKIKAYKSAEWHGKAATVSIYATIMLHLLWPVFAKGADIPLAVSVISVAVATVLIVLSFVLYTVRNIKLIRTGQPENENSAE